MSRAARTALICELRRHPRRSQLTLSGPISHGRPIISTPPTIPSSIDLDIPHITKTQVGHKYDI